MLHLLVALFIISFHDREVSRYRPKQSFTYYILVFFGLWNDKIEHWFKTNTSNRDSWLIHNAFSFLANGFKFWSAINCMSFFALASLYIATLYIMPIWCIIVLAIGLYALNGAIHSILDGTLFNKRS